MKRPHLLALAVVAAILLGGPVFAQAAGSGPDEGSDGEAESKPRPARQDVVAAVTEWARGVDTVVASVSLTDTDVDSYIKHREGFNAAMKHEKALAKFSVNLKEAYDLTVKSEVYLNWAKEVGLDPADWLQKAVRVRVLEYRMRAETELPTRKQRIAQRLKLVEAEQHGLSTSDYENAVEALTTTLKLIDDLTGVLKTLPVASDDERAVLLAKGGELR